MEVSEGFSVSNDSTILRGKRSRRPRPPPVPSSSDNSSSPTPTSTSGADEEEDIANCLILLARGLHKPPSSSSSSSSAAYHCKTCGKIFPSFQALGGHRASHKKPKPNATTESPKTSPCHRELGESSTPPIIWRPDGLQNKGKTHECSICGSEFGSGQALGGHMRKHRPVGPGPATIGTYDDDSATMTSFDDNADKSRSVLAFDLNLPAPSEDDRFRQLSPHLGFAAAGAAALVDCHY